MPSDDTKPPKDPKDDPAAEPAPVDAEIKVGDAKETAETVKETGEPFDSNFA